MIRRVSILFLLIAFASITVFGFAAMGNHAEGRCIAATSEQADCPGESGAASAVFHVGAFKKFSTAVLSGWTEFLFGFSFLFALLGFLISFCKPSPALRFMPVSESSASCRRNIFRWLSLLEHSPTNA